MVLCKERNHNTDCRKDSTIQKHDQKRPSIKDQTCINRQCQNQDHSTGIKTTKTSTDDLSCDKLPQRCR